MEQGLHARHSVLAIFILYLVEKLCYQRLGYASAGGVLSMVNR
jgi:hypothetical protein